MLSIRVAANTLRDGELLPERESKQRYELIQKKMKFTEDDVSAMIAKSREVCKRLRKLGMSRKTVTTHRLKELRHLRAGEKLATWRRSYGFDRCDVRDGQWVHSPLPPTLEQTTASMWADLNALKEAISMLGKDRSKERVESFLNELKGGTANFTDEEFARLKRIMESRGSDAAHVVVAPIGTAQPCNPDRIVQNYRSMHVFV